MRVCLDTNVLVRLFGTRPQFAAIKHALLTGGLDLAVSNEVLLEYEEVIVRLSGRDRWRQIEELFEKLAALHGNIVRVAPQFRFQVIANDPDDNKFVDCAIAAQADFVVTSDAAFIALRNAGYKPQPIGPDEFIAQHLPSISPP